MDLPAWLKSSAVCLGTLEAGVAPPALSERGVEEALHRPVWPDGGTATVFDLVRPGESLCLVVSDATRKTAADRILPVVLAGLARRGCRPDDASILFATGIHRPPRPEEMERILGREIFRTFQGRIHVHDADDDANLVAVGTTRRGHVVRVNRRAIGADRLVPIGTATYHYHAGFGGGRKSLVPGLAARETIAYNHSLTLDPEHDRLHPGVAPGALDGNPVAEEMLEGARLCAPDMVITTVVDPSDRLVGLFSGELNAAHRAACRLVEPMCGVALREPADVVIASAGTAPDWVQSHKALFNASRAVKEGAGRIVLEAPCPEGVGNARFRHWLRRPTLEELFRELRRAPEVNGQTALSTRLRGRQAILVTGMNAQDRADVGIRTAPDLDTALRQALDDVGASAAGKPSYYVMPHAGQIVPFCPGAMR